ncbi:hypothetical protein [Terrimonas pollutisoli]|uniref:hypothetical protein n=1 Tax=Terrimonas pollutisoli TaxID=3034147 RepID=UPI0023EC735A|nr:hypothetical protein [Terrimonas sp. H1YJ31]
MFGRKRNKEQKENPLQDKVAGTIAGAGIKMQSKFTDFMNKLFAGMNIKKLKTFLIAFCLSCGGYSIYLIANAIFSSDKKQRSFQIDQVEVPKHFDKAGDEIIPPESYVDKETYRKIQRFKQYMDSLQINKSKLYDSIMIARPGLMDSILMLEEIYNSQKLK